MRKGIKILGKVFSVAVLLLIILPMVLSLLLDIPAVQNYVVQKAVRMVSRKLETTVSIDRVDIGLFSKVKVKGFYVEDYQRDTLLYVGSLDAYITGLHLRRRGSTQPRRDRRGEALPARDPRGGDEHQADRQPHQRPRQAPEGQFPPVAAQGFHRRHGSLPGAAHAARPRIRHRLQPHAPLRHLGACRRLHHRRAVDLHHHRGHVGT